MLKIALVTPNSNELNNRLIQILKSHPMDLKFHWVENNSNDLSRVIKQKSISIVLFEIKKWGLLEKKALQQIKQNRPNIKVFVVAGNRTEDEIVDILRIKVDAILLSYSNEREFLKALDALIHNEKYLCGDIMNILIQKMITMNSDSHFIINSDMREKLTSREIEITQFILKGHSSKEIADLLCVSKHTISTHRKNIFRKLKVHKATELIQICKSQSI